MTIKLNEHIWHPRRHFGLVERFLYWKKTTGISLWWAKWCDWSNIGSSTRICSCSTTLLMITTNNILSTVRLYVTRFWKISPNVIFYNSNIYHHNEEWQLPIKSTVVIQFVVHAFNYQKIMWKFCNPFSYATTNGVILCISLWH